MIILAQLLLNTLPSAEADAAVALPDVRNEHRAEISGVLDAVIIARAPIEGGRGRNGTNTAAGTLGYRSIPGW